MIKRMICIECPKGCDLTVDIENCRAVSVKGAKCPKGIIYAASEIENPTRIFTTTVFTEGLDLKFVPVRTDKPIPKKDLSRAVEESARITVSAPLKAGDIVVENFLGLGVKLLATREATKAP